MFIFGLALYATSSLLGGLAGTALFMITARAVQGIGGAFLFPATISLINTLFEEGPPRNRALGLWSLAGSSGLTLGSIVGGVLVGTLGWPSVFFVNVPISILVGLVAIIAIPRDLPASSNKNLDVPGALVSTAGVTLLVLTLVQAPQWGWASIWTAMGILGAVICFGAFILIEARAIQPIVPLDLIGRANLAPSMMLTFLYMGTFMSLPYFTTELFQRAYQFNPVQTGLAFLVPCLAIAVGTQLGSRLAARLGVHTLLVLGLMVGTAGAILIAANITPNGGYAALVPGLIVFGLGQGTAWPPMWISAAAGIPAHEQGIASGIASTTLWIGGATGLAVLVAVASPSVGHLTADQALVLFRTSRVAVFAIAAGIAMTIPVTFFINRGQTKSSAVISH